MIAKPRLPLLAAHERAHTYCTYCPKLCRVACPVSEVQARETTTPWGKMSTLHHVAAGDTPLRADHAESFWACTGCLRCRSYCAHETNVPAALHAGRAEAHAAGVSPASARAVITRHAARERRARDAAAAMGDVGQRAARTVYVPGCTGVVREPAAARDGLRATRALAGDVRVVADRCCGLPLHDAGDAAGFRAAASAFVARLEGAERAVFHDPGCLHALSVIAPHVGVSAPRTQLLHLSQLAAEQLVRLRRTPQDGPVRWKDPCRLGRGLGVYDAPRAVLARILGRAPDEMPASHALAECSGAGGQLPRTDRASADAIADERLAGHARAGGGMLVTGCPGATGALRRRAANPERVVDLATLLARSLA